MWYHFDILLTFCMLVDQTSSSLLQFFNRSNNILTCSPSGTDNPMGTVTFLNKYHNSYYYQGSEIPRGDWFDKVVHQSSIHNVGIRVDSKLLRECFIHFQGMMNKNMMYVYGRAFENILNA